MSTRVAFDVTELFAKYDPRGKLESYHELLMAENQRVNLVSRETTREKFNRMVAECLLPLDQLDGRTFEHYLDIGAGGGLPLVPLMIARIASHATAAERTHKKARILGQICKALDLPATVRPQTIEDLSFKQQFNLISIRYVKLTEPLFRTISHLLAPGGVVVYYSAVPLKLNDFEITEYNFLDGASDTPKVFSIISSKA